MKKLVLLSVALILAVVFSVGPQRATQVEASPGWYHVSWSKRAPISVDNTGNPNTVTDYQVRIDVAYDSDMEPDFDDLRFTDSDETSELPYWVQHYTASTSATVWVKVPSIPASSVKTIYMYYGNPAASSASNGDNTFLFFDDFSGATLDTGKWDNLCDSLGTATILDGKLRLDSPEGHPVNPANPAYSDHNYARVRTKMSFGSVCVEYKWWLVTWPVCPTVIDTNRGPQTRLDLSDGVIGIERHRNHYCAGVGLNYYDRVWSWVTVSGASVCWHGINLEANPPMEGRFSIDKYGTTANIYYDDMLVLSCDDAMIADTGPLSLWVYGDFLCPHGTADIDDVFVRNYTSPEPTTGVGAEVTCAEVITATATGTAQFCCGSGTIENPAAIPENTLPSAGKPNLQFPHGFFSFDITGLSIGETVVVSIELPSAVPVGTQYWKYHASEGGWIRIPMGSDDGDNIVTITLVDGGLGDDDGVADGTIVDQGGPGQPLPPAPPAPRVPAFPTLYVGIAAAFGAAILAFFVRRRLVHQE